MAGKIRLENATGDFSGFESGDGTADVIWKLPDADGSDGEVLTTDGAKVLSWTSGTANMGALCGSTTWKCSDAVGTNTDPSTWTDSKVNPTLFSTNFASGDLTITFLKKGEYRLFMTMAHYHSNSYTGGNGIILYAGTAARHGAGSVRCYTQPDVDGDGNDSGELIIVAEAGETVVLNAYSKINATAAIDHTWAMYIILMPVTLG